ncbi:hypothetical protein T5B8_08464 [Salinisphaera sp. T5B8]|uniref:hypothetical protein n=1 Tax=Salinisphaera sp. T5B8 TaxID=1304154 RepID=UPI00333EF5DE
MRHIRAIQTAVAVLLVLSWLVGHSQPGPDSSAPNRATNADGPPIMPLSEDLLSRLEAVEADVEASDEIDALGDDDTQPQANNMADSIEQAGDRLDADPRKRALLARHDFDGRSYVRAYMSLVLAQVNAFVTQGNGQAPGMPPLVQRNVDFYNKHKSRIDDLLTSTGTQSPQMSEKSAEGMKRLSKMGPGRMQDCLTTAAGLLPVVALGVPGSVEVDNEQLREIADSISEAAREVHADTPREQMNTMADVLRHHPGHAPLESPRFEAALNELKAWTDAHCEELQN